MKITRTSNEKKTVKMSRKEWESIGKKAGWIDRQAQQSQNTEGLLRRLIGQDVSVDFSTPDFYGSVFLRRSLSGSPGYGCCSR